MRQWAALIQARESEKPACGFVIILVKIFGVNSFLACTNMLKIELELICIWYVILC